MEDLLQQPLAFSQDSSLIAASSRLAVETSDGALLNVEVFDCGSANVLLLVIPGVCESAETKGVQAIVKAAKETSSFEGKVAVLELQGHGLSSGERCVCPSLERLVDHVVQTIRFVEKELFQDDSNPSIYLMGNSLGGVLAIYAALELPKKHSLQGICPIAPAVGMDPRMLPPTPIVYGLSALAYIAPSLQVSLTPCEDPTSYNCPKDTARNFSGHWPLATSKMLLDVTSEIVPTDIQQGKLGMEKVPSVLVVAGKQDRAVPLEAVEAFYEGVQSPHKDLLKLKKAGHDLLFQPKFSLQISKTLFDWIEEREKQKQQQS